MSQLAQQASYTMCVSKTQERCASPLASARPTLRILASPEIRINAFPHKAGQAPTPVQAQHIQVGHRKRCAGAQSGTVPHQPMTFPSPKKKHTCCTAACLNEPPSHAVEQTCKQ